MITLYFLRHGIAEDAGPGMKDYDRRLTSEGRDNLVLEAKGLKALELKLDVIVTSPLIRARETAVIVAEELGVNKALHIDERLACGCSMGELRQLVDDYAELERIMLVGHNPDFTILPAQLSGGANLRMQKGSIARVDLNDVKPGGGELRWLLPPKLLMAAACSGKIGESVEP